MSKEPKHRGKITGHCKQCGRVMWRFYSQWHPELCCSKECGSLYRKQKNFAQRFWKKVALTEGEGCWFWQSRRFRNGYGMLHHGDRRLLAHRVAWELTHGAIPDGMFICHRCDAPACVRPGHLFLGTPADNVADMQQKGRKQYTYGEQTHNAKLRDADIPTIMDLRGKVPQRVIADMFGVSSGTIGSIHRGARWKHVQRETVPTRRYQRITREQVAIIKGLRGKMLYRDIAARFGISLRHAEGIMRGEAWKDVLPIIEPLEEIE